MIVKTSILILLLSCAGLFAQTNPVVTNVDPAVTEMLRARLRAAMSNNGTLPPLTTIQTNAGTNTNTNTVAPVHHIPAGARPSAAFANPGTNVITSVSANTNVTTLLATSTNGSIASTTTTTTSTTLTSTNANALGEAGSNAVPPFLGHRRPPGVLPPGMGGQVPPMAAPALATPNLGTSNVAGQTPPPAAPGMTPPPLAPAATEPPPEATLKAGELDFPDMDLDQVLDVYGQLVNRTILRAQLPQVKIRLRTQTDLTKTEATQALESVLAMNGVTVINVGDKFVKVVPLNLAVAQAEPFNTNEASALKENDQFISQVINLKYIKPSVVVPVIQGFSAVPNSILAFDDNQLLIIRDYSANVKRMLELIKQLDMIVPLDIESEVIPIKYAQASDIASALSSLGGSGGSGGTSIGKGASVGSGNRTGATGGLGGSSTGSLGGLGGGGGGFGSTAGSLSSPLAGGGAAGASGAGSTFASRLSGIIQKASAQGDFRILGNTKIIADARTNSLLVYASKEDMKMIKKIIGELDIVLAQVLIEGIIMEVTLDRGQNVGFSYLQNNPSTPGNYFSGAGAVNNVGFLNMSNILNASTNSIGGGLSYFGNFGGDFNASVTAIATDDRINVLSKPRIQTSHGVAANIQVGQTVPEVSGTYFGGINGQASSQYNQQFVGISLQVTPLINPDGLVVMDITANVQALGPNYTIDNNTVPSTTQRSAQSTVSVRDRDTIILGGMISTTKSTSHSGVPYLKDIPGLGFLFRTSNDTSQRTELIILLRPTVLPTPETAALVAAHERAKLPGIKAAERETAIDENRRLKEADAIKVPPPTRE